ncbi:MAG TPA: amidohydrolase family protein [Gammaproteobacteria bacterium]
MQIERPLRTLAALACAALAVASARAQEVTVFRDVNVVPMDSERVLEGQTVIVRGERIASIEPASAADVPPDARVIDGRGRYLTPGLAEMHAHVPAGDRDTVEEVLFLYVANGVTTARGMLGQPMHLELREQLARHEVLGPRLYTSGPSLNDQRVDGPNDATRMVHEQARDGYDFVKVHPGPTRAEYDAAVEAARTAGIRLAGHVPEDVGVMRAIEARQATIDHLDGYVQFLVPEERRGPAGFFGLALVDAVDRSRIPAAVAATVSAGVWVVPTQTLIDNLPGPSPGVEELLARPEMAYVSPLTREQWAAAKRRLMSAPGYSAEDARQLTQLRRELVKALHDAGAGLLLGSDAPQVFNVPGFSLHHELAAMVEAGLTPYEALRMGTANPAVFFEAEHEFGTIREGLAADLILVADNPLEDVSALSRIEGVMVRGRWLDRESIDRRLDAIAARYRR